jgi:hypothetical protein
VAWTTVPSSPCSANEAWSGYILAGQSTKSGKTPRVAPSSVRRALRDVCEGVFYLGSAAFNLVSTTPTPKEVFEAFGGMAWVRPYERATEEIVILGAKPVAVALVVLETTVGVAILQGGRWRQLGLVSATVSCSGCPLPGMALLAGQRGAGGGAAGRASWRPVPSGVVERARAPPNVEDGARTRISPTVGLGGEADQRGRAHGLPGRTGHPDAAHRLEIAHVTGEACE